ncbi:MAG: glycine oxidase ThiO [Gemmatimonadota bacterium]
MSDRSGADVVVIGAGPIGCAIARLLALRGADVIVVERDSPGRAAGWAAGGMLSPLAEADGPGPFLDLAFASLDRFPRLVSALEAATGVDLEYRASGKLEIALDEARAARLEARFRWQREHGYDTEWLDEGAARRLEPALTDAVRAAIRIAPDHRLDNRRFARALWIGARLAGAAFRLGSPAVRIATRPAARADAPGLAVDGVDLADGASLRADHVVVAAGCWSGRIRGLPRPLPVFPVRGQMVAVEAVPPPLERVVANAAGYVIPRADGRLIIGSTMERVGYRAHPTAQGVATLLRRGLCMVPGLAEARVAETWAGLRPGTPDGRPVLGEDPDVEGLIYATGHFRNGILLTPITAEIVEAAIVGEEPPVTLAPFAAHRDFEVESGAATHGKRAARDVDADSGRDA